MIAANPAFDPVRPVMFAKVRRSEHDDSLTLIGDRVTSQCGSLQRQLRDPPPDPGAVLRAHEETDAQLGTLADAAVSLMGGVLGPLGDLITTLPVGPEHPGRNAGPSFELFYEDDDLLPHRESAWALLEARARCLDLLRCRHQELSGAGRDRARTDSGRADRRGRLACCAFRRLGRRQSLYERRWGDTPSMPGSGRANRLRAAHQATVPRARPRLDAFQLRSLVPGGGLDARRRHPASSRRRHDAVRRRMARRACRRLPPLDRPANPHRSSLASLTQIIGGADRERQPAQLHPRFSNAAPRQRTMSGRGVPRFERLLIVRCDHLGICWLFDRYLGGTRSSYVTPLLGG